MARTRGWNVALAGDEDDRPLSAWGAQRFLQRETVKVRHADIEDRTARKCAVMVREKFLRRNEGLRLVSVRADQARQRFQDAGIVIHDEYGCASLGHCAAISIS